MAKTKAGKKKEKLKLLGSHFYILCLYKFDPNFD